MRRSVGSWCRRSGSMSTWLFLWTSWARSSRIWSPNRKKSTSRSMARPLKFSKKPSSHTYKKCSTSSLRKPKRAHLSYIRLYRILLGFWHSTSCRRQTTTTPWMSFCNKFWKCLTRYSAKREARMRKLLEPSVWVKWFKTREMSFYGTTLMPIWRRSSAFSKAVLCVLMPPYSKVLSASSSI